MNPDINQLQPYPFEKLAALKAGIAPPAGLAPIALSIGEPKHPAPAFVLETLQRELKGFNLYPQTRGIAALREAIANWLQHRFGLRAVDPDTQVLPVSGTREALFSFAQAVVDRSSDALVLCPNPFYQIYEGAALLAGATPWFVQCRADRGWQPDFDSVPADIWRRCQLLYLCSPGNPTGAVVSMATLQRLIALADEFDFVIAGDECYSEIYNDEAAPPPGLLQACAAMGRDDYARCVVFHSLSKRSNLPGLRSGFVAGDARLLAPYLQYRTYHGAAMPLPHQLASIQAWGDEQHVRDNRAVYRRKFDAVIARLNATLPVQAPDAGFYLWAATPGDDTAFARELFRHSHVTVLPGSYLARECNGHNPGAGRVRMALVAGEAECLEAAGRIAAFMEQYHRA
ncbi:MAG TPA: succinyldiaminopimelate transaminase [Spongiibacteraceae bacterium]|nr:succinyldiaminopimelate transaminase [Spongiibacteraceae bacterium]